MKLQHINAYHSISRISLLNHPNIISMYNMYNMYKMYKHPPDFPQQHQALRLQMGALLRGSGSGKTELSRGLATAFGTSAMAALGAESYGKLWKNRGDFPMGFLGDSSTCKMHLYFSALKSGFKFSMISPRGVEGLKQWDDLDDLTLMGSKHGDF